MTSISKTKKVKILSKEDKIKELKKEFRKSFPKTVYISRDLKRIGFESCNYYYRGSIRTFSNARIKGNILYVNVDNINDSNLNRNIEILTGFWEKYAIINELSAIYVRMNTNKESLQAMSDINFENNTSKNAKFINKFFSSYENDYFVKILDQEKFDKVYNVLNPIEKHLIQLNKKNPTIVYNLTSASNYGINCFDFYYEGKYVSLDFNSAADVPFLELKEKNQKESSLNYKIELSDGFEIDDIINSIFDKLDRTVKFANLFSYPTKFFDEFYSRNLRFLDKKYKSVILSSLEEKHSKKDLEMHFSVNKEFDYFKYSQNSWGSSGFYLFKIYDIYFTIDEDFNIEKFDNQLEAREFLVSSFVEKQKNIFETKLNSKKIV